MELQLKFSFLCWNLENFFLVPSPIPNIPRKAKEKTEKIAEVVKELNPDILFLTEVGGRDSLELFNKEYLNENYKVSLLKGNSNRGIEIGYLISKDFLDKNNLIFDHIGHARKPIEFLYPHEKLQNQKAMIKGQKPLHRSHFLSRDLAELRIYKKNDHLKIRPLLCLLGVHLKSKLDKEGIDWQGTKRRQAEASYLAEIYKKRNEKWNGKCPIFITGDFNGELNKEKRDPEFRDLYQLDGVLDFTEHLKLPREESFSFIGMDKNKRSFGIQLDYFMLHKDYVPYLDKKHCGFYRYKNSEGGVIPIPQNPGAKYGLPSDHYPLFIEFKSGLLES